MELSHVVFVTGEGQQANDNAKYGEQMA